MTTDDFLRRQIIPLAYRQLSAGELMARARHNDPEAFIALVCVKYSMIEGVCRAALGPCGPFEDLAQETFVQLWRQRHKIRDPGAVDGWLAKTAQNLALKFQAAQARQQVASREWFHRTGEGIDVKIPDRVTIQEELVARVRQAISEQSDDDQRVLWAAEHAGGDAHAAEALGLPVSTYRVRLHRARQKLRSLLRKYGVAPVVGTLAILGTVRNRATSAIASLWKSFAGKAVLIGVPLFVAAAVAGWALNRESQEVTAPPPAPPPSLISVPQAPELSLQERNRRILENDIVPKLREITQKYYPPDNPLRVAGIRAFGSEVEVEFEATHPPHPDQQANRMRGRFCTWRRQLIVTGQPTGQNKWYRMRPERAGAIVAQLPFIGATEIVLGYGAYAAVVQLFEQLPRDTRAESEHIRFLFGEPGGEFRLPAGANGFAIDDGRMWLVDGDLNMYVRDRNGRWRFDSACPGWWLVAHKGRLYCTAGDDIFTRAADEPHKPWERWRTFPEIKPGEERGFLAVAGDRFYAAIHPDVVCNCPIDDPKAPWVREQSTTPLWPSSIAATKEQIYGHDARHLVTRSVGDPSAPWKPIGPWIDDITFLAVDGDRLLGFGGPGSVYSRSLTAGPEVDWEIVGKAHEPPRP